jgi:ATP-dependent DNA helicase RecG
MNFDENQELNNLLRLTPIQKKGLAKLGLKTIRDLLYYFPVRYGDTAETKNINSLTQGDNATVFGKISRLKTSKGYKSKIPMADAYVEDESGSIHCVWFNQPYVAKMFKDDMLVRIEGKVSQRKKTGEMYISNPKIEAVNKLPINVGDSLFGSNGEQHSLYPVYKETAGITSTWIYHAINKIFKAIDIEKITDPIPSEILQKYNLPNIKTALIWIHTPIKRDDATSALKRFAFEEIFIIQLSKQKSRKTYENMPSFKIEPKNQEVNEFIKRFPFEATNAQKSAVENILKDMSSGKVMSRLLEGDVGSGKTAVAGAVSYAIINSVPINQTFGRLQVAYMCPTEILATQHFESFIQYFSYLGINIALITSSGCRKFPSKVNPKGWTQISRSQLLKWVENGEIAVVIGTHSLIQKSVKFKHLALAIIDEQHRFGTKQRSALVKKHDKTPHLLSMTATPIPRTLALTMYGDLDLTVLDESPKGRKQIITELILPKDRDAIYEKIRLELSAGRQMYVICPRIDAPDPDKEDALMAKSVKEEAKRLKKDVFQEYEIDILHSKMSTKAKDETMERFKNKKIDILCATSVVEVGVNVPNATIIIIEGAERFGLAQLHQLRGRVMRSTHQSYCYVFTDSKTETSINRLNALKTAKNGFELAELDLANRGAGELSGGKQWGVSDLAMSALRNIKMVEFAREEARNIIENDTELNSYPTLKKLVNMQESQNHWE